MAKHIAVKTDKDIYDLPTIAMRGLVVFPNNIIHFEVGREKSIAAIEWAMSNDSDIYLVTQKQIDIESPHVTDLYAYGVVAEIKQVLHVSDDLVKVLVRGKYRAKLLELNENSDIFLRSTVKKAPVTGTHIENKIETDAIVRRLKACFERYLSLGPQISKDVIYNILSSDSAVYLSEYMPANLLMKYQDKQAVLNESTLSSRLDKLLVLLQRECEVLAFEQELEDKVNEQMEKNQRDYYLREQMHIISEELGEGEDTHAEADTYRTKISALGLDEEVQAKLLKEVDRLARMQGNSAEAGVIRTYLDTCIELPWHKTTKDHLDIKKAQRILDKDHYGLEKVKDRILEIMAVRQLNPEIKGQIICLVGPPGIGKTSIARSVAECMGRKYVRMSLGGVRDEAEIRGHRRTYIGAMPGKLISAVITSRSQNPLILMDEIDKLANDFRGDPASALLEVLDPEQNCAFKDHYLDIPFDLSNVLFITTANDISAIPGPLRDRMDVIELPSYTRVEKFNIAKKHLLQKQLKNTGLKGKVTFTDGALYGIVDGYTRESGVRNLERVIQQVLRRCAKQIAAGETEKISVTVASLEKILGPRKVKPDFISRSSTVGIANGLAWTSVGGEMLPIEVQAISGGTGKIEVTGSLGNVMKESAKLAVTYVRVNGSKYGIDTAGLKEIDLHIHAPDGATPKDGPSAGVTLTTALVSCLSGWPVRAEVAMTGEISLHGRVLPIGGLREKSMAAYREGMKIVLIPKENESDLYEIDQEVKDAIQFLPMTNLSQVLNAALIKPEHIKKNIAASVPPAKSLETPAAVM